MLGSSPLSFLVKHQDTAQAEPPSPDTVQGNVQLRFLTQQSAHKRLSLSKALSHITARLAEDVGAFLHALRAHLPALQGPASSARFDLMDEGDGVTEVWCTLNGVRLVDRLRPSVPFQSLLERALSHKALAGLSPANRAFYPGEIFERPFPTMNMVAATSPEEARTLLRVLDPAMIAR